MLLDLEGSITTQELAENFTVSVRTIKYDLEDIRAWLHGHALSPLFFSLYT
jgi:transcriptional antiterminator